MRIQLANLKDDLDAICAQMQPGLWAEDNHKTNYKPEPSVIYAYKVQ